MLVNVFFSTRKWRKNPTTYICTLESLASHGMQLTLHLIIHSWLITSSCALDRLLVILGRPWVTAKVEKCVCAFDDNPWASGTHDIAHRQFELIHQYHHHPSTSTPHLLIARAIGLGHVEDKLPCDSLCLLLMFFELTSHLRIPTRIPWRWLFLIGILIIPFNWCISFSLNIHVDLVWKGCEPQSSLITNHESQVSLQLWKHVLLLRELFLHVPGQNNRETEKRCHPEAHTQMSETFMRVSKDQRPMVDDYGGCMKRR